MTHYNTARTIRAPIFLRFALLALEYREWFERQWPPGVLLDPRFPKRAADLSDEDLAQIARQHDSALDSQRLFQGLYLQHAGVSSELLERPEMQAYLGLAAHRAIRAAPVDAGWGERRLNLRDEDFRFSRRLVHRVVAGTFLTFGNRKRKDTAHFLNQGAPTRGSGIAYTHVRSPLDAVLRSLWRSTGPDVVQWEIAMWHCAAEVQAAHALWRELGGQPGKSGADAENALLAMIDSGDFHDAYTAALEGAMTANSMPDVGPLVRQQVKRLQIELRKRNKKEGEDSQHPPGQAEDFHRRRDCEPCAH